MALDTYALTTLANANTELGLTSDGGAVDAHVENLINRASDIIESALHRKLKARLYIKERHSGIGQEQLYFKQYPVLSLNLDNLAWVAAAKTLTRNDGGSFVTDGFAVADKVLVQNSEYNSGLLTIAAAGVATLVLTFTDVIVDDAVDDNVFISHCRELWVNDGVMDEDDYEVNPDHIYYRSGFSEGHENIRVTYYAGYATIPDDIEDFCLELVKRAYDKSKDVKSEKLGPYSITYFDSRSDLIKEIQNELSTYINVVV